MFINDLTVNIQSSCPLFADDTLLYRTIHSNSDRNILQNDINTLHNWSVRNGMKFNVSKTKVMYITRKRVVARSSYHLDGQPLDVVNTYKYLGVTIDSTLCWDAHIDSIITKGNQILGLMFHIAGGASSTAFVSLYKTLLLPVLEYGLPAWLPHHKRQIKRLEGIQRRVTRYILKVGRGEMSYEERLRSLRWASLEDRRDQILLKFTFKCLSNVTDCEAVKENIQINQRHSDIMTFNHLSACTNSLHNSFINRFPRIWSTLPLSVKDSALLDSFQTFSLKLRNHFIV
jgi:predicted component of type VI protein secretion system